uniref:Telomerase reverse transcriptase n=1 Tax=Heligmosomoides polygyrus TaxID=6339 RepID=A0A183F811_HELPZ
LGLRPKPSTQPPRPSYSLRPGARQRTSQQRLGIGLSLKRHPFSGLVDSAAGTDFHGHRPAVYINQRLLWGLMSEKLGTLTQRLVHPTAPVLLTKNGPLGARVRVNSSMKKPRQHTH